ncbi:MAG: hypothetical protein ACLTYN_15085 [Dysosmobacter welbionis]
MGNVKESTIPQTEHEYETQVLPATCTSPGYTLNECVGLRGPAHHRPYPCAVPRLCRQDHPGRLETGARPSTPALAAVPPS